MDRPAGAVLANTLRWLVMLGLAVAVGSAWWSQPVWEAGEHAGHNHSDADAGSYTCPMHPTYVQDRPGSCPICGMDLVPSASLQATKSKDPHTFVLADLPGVAPVVIPTERLQRSGVQLGKAERRDLLAVQTQLAVVRRDPARTAEVQARAAGWVEWLRPLQPGDRVKKGEVLARLYSREVDAAQAELQATRAAAAAALEPDSARSMQEEAARRVRSLGGSGAGGKRGGVAVRAPRDGVVVSWQAQRGSYFTPGQALGRVADADALQVEAELRPDLAQALQATAEPVGAESRPDAAQWFAQWQHQRAPLQPLGHAAASPSGRGLLVRFGLQTQPAEQWPDGAQVVLERQLMRRNTLVVARAAVVEADGRSWVYRRAPSGRLWPTPVVLGLRDAAFVEVLQGLSDGDALVVRGTFLVDAEARLAPLPADPSGLTEAAPPAAALAGGDPAASQAAPLSKEALEALVSATEAMARDDAEATGKALQQLAGALQEPLPFAPTLQAARTGWQAWLQRLWPQLRATPEAQTLHVAFCPMAPGSWLQRGPELRNPYYGAQMLRCGELMGTVASLATAPAAEESP